MHYEIAQFLIGLGAITEMLGANYQIINCKLARHAGVQWTGGWVVFLRQLFLQSMAVTGWKNKLISVLKVGCFLILICYLLTYFLFFTYLFFTFFYFFFIFFVFIMC